MSRMRMATALALSAGGCMAFVTPSDVHSTAAAPSMSLRASAAGGARQGNGNLLSMAGTAVAVSALGLAMKRLNRRSSESSMPRQVVGVCLPLSDKFDPLELSSTDAKMGEIHTSGDQTWTSSHDCHYGNILCLRFSASQDVRLSSMAWVLWSPFLWKAGCNCLHSLVPMRCS